MKTMILSFKKVGEDYISETPIGKFELSYRYHGGYNLIFRYNKYHKDYGYCYDFLTGTKKEKIHEAREWFENTQKEHLLNYYKSVMKENKYQYNKLLNK